MRQSQYVRHAWLHAPKTFARRVLFGRDPYWRQYFYSRWGWVPRPEGNGQRILIDALSGGEVTQLRSFSRALRQSLPDATVVLSTFNFEAFTYARRHLDVDLVVDTPWDMPLTVRRALKRLMPTVVAFVQNVHNPVLAREAKALGARNILISGFMREGFEHHKLMVRAMELGFHRDLHLVGARTETDAAGFERIGVPRDRIRVVGDLKFDPGALAVDEKERERLRGEFGLGITTPLVVAGSVHPGEDLEVAKACEMVRHEVPTLKLILAPRYLQSVARLEAGLQELGIPYVRRTQFGRENQRTPSVIILDTFGELARLYALASVVFIGGSLQKRNEPGYGQNICEPLVHGKPVLFGPYMGQWKNETETLARVWPDVQVSGAMQMSAALLGILRSPPLQAALAEAAIVAVRPHADAVERNVALITDVLDSPSQLRT